jgi:hypothetical protein
MMKVYTQELVYELDVILCKLESLGTVLTQLTTMEDQKPDLTSIADLGRLIREQAETGLERICEGQEVIDIRTFPEDFFAPQVTECTREIGFVKRGTSNGNLQDSDN